MDDCVIILNVNIFSKLARLYCMMFVPGLAFTGYRVEDFKRLDLPALVDMLAYHTARYMTILSEGGTMEEYQASKLIIHYLQKEIESRKKELEEGQKPAEPDYES